MGPARARSWVDRADARFQPRPGQQRVHAPQKALPPRLARLPVILHVGK